MSRGQAQAPAGLPPDLVARRERTWRELQCDLAALSSRSAHLIAEHSGHLVNQDQPDAVVQGIRQALALVRESGNTEAAQQAEPANAGLLPLRTVLPSPH